MKQYTAKERLVRHGREIWKNRAAYLLMAPFMVIFFVFTVFPVLMTIVLSFTEYNILQEPTWVGWQNYRDLFVNDKEFAIALRNTVVFALITGPVGYFLSFFAAWIINEFTGDPRYFDLHFLHSHHIRYGVHHLGHPVLRRYVRLCQQLSAEAGHHRQSH